MWQQWINGVLGAWLLAVPLIGFSRSGLKSWVIVIGMALIILAVWSSVLRDSVNQNKR